MNQPIRINPPKEDSAVQLDKIEKSMLALSKVLISLSFLIFKNYKGKNKPKTETDYEGILASAQARYESKNSSEN